MAKAKNEYQRCEIRIKKGEKVIASSYLGGGKAATEDPL